MFVPRASGAAGGTSAVPVRDSGAARESQGNTLTGTEGPEEAALCTQTLHGAAPELFVPPDSGKCRLE